MINASGLPIVHNGIRGIIYHTDLLMRQYAFYYIDENGESGRVWVKNTKAIRRMIRNKVIIINQ